MKSTFLTPSQVQPRASVSASSLSLEVIAGIGIVTRTGTGTATGAGNHGRVEGESSMVSSELGISGSGHAALGTSHDMSGQQPDPRTAPKAQSRYRCIQAECEGKGAGGSKGGMSPL